MNKNFLLSLVIFSLVFHYGICESEVISEPIPGQQYVFVHTSDNGARPISRKEKSTDAADRPFETGHKIPTILTFKQERESEEVFDKDLIKKKENIKNEKPIKHSIKEKREAAKDPAPAPVGSIVLDPKKLYERYRSEIEASKKSSKTSGSTTTTTTAPSTTKKVAPKRPARGRSRTKKEAPTTPSSILTTGAPVTPRSLLLNSDGVKDDKLTGSGTENKRSRVQIKKGPNGQEYEYEYVYYYYDDDIDDNKKDSKAKITNSHDGPAKNSITPNRGRTSSTTTTTTTSHPEFIANEVVPSTRGNRQRGRQLNHEVPEEKVAEERLPQNTRFPPRSRNINTTPTTIEDDSKTKTRQRGKPQGQAIDNTADETQQVNGGRGRNRANVRRPSLELVDSASFNTHSSNDPGVEPYKEPKARGEQGKNSAEGPSFPSVLPDGPVRFLGATPNEKMDLQELKSRLVDAEESVTKTDSDSSVTTEEGATTQMSAMDKVALDLYAILQGTQKLSGEDKDESSTDSDSITTDNVDTTDETTTDILTTVEQTTFSSTSTTTTTTTTTTTAKPTTTTTTTEPPTGRGRFRGRPGASGGNRFKSGSTTTTTPEPSTEKSKNRFARPSFGSRPRPGVKATTEASEPEATKTESKPVNSARQPIGNRNRFSSRGRPSSSTTVAPETQETSTSSSTRTGISRPRPNSFNLNSRRRGGATSTTKEPTDGGDTGGETHDDHSTTAKPIRGRIGSNNISPRPLRPGPRINLAARGRPGVATSTAVPVSENGAEHETNSEDSAQSEGEDKTSETTPQPAGNVNSLKNLRNRPKLTVTAARPKNAASAPVQVRRTNPLLARRKPALNGSGGGGSSTETSEVPTETSQDTSVAATDVPEEENQAPNDVASSTTEEPRGLNKLLAGRRRLVKPAQPTNHS